MECERHSVAYVLLREGMRLEGEKAAKSVQNKN